MPIDTHPKHKRSPEEIIAEQKVDAARAKTRVVAAKPAPSVPTVAPPDTRTDVERYIDEIAPSTIAGQMVKFSKEGKFVVAETEEEISPDKDFIALCDETLIGWIKFRDDGEPPERHQGLLYNAFVMPSRQSLGDLDERQWPEGLSGGPADPWRHQMYLVLQEPETQAYYTFVTSSVTGRNGVGKLLRHYDRMRRNDTNSYPVVRLKPSGYQSKKPGVGWVSTPSFVVFGRTPKNLAALPDTSVAADLNDSLPF